jgi:cytidylate kinase
MSVVTVSRQLGSYGMHIAEEVAARLSAVCVDKEVLAEMAQREGVSVEMIVQAEKRLVSRPVLVSEEMKSLFAAQARKQGSLGDVNNFVSQLGAAIRALADQDNVVFVGRGTQLLLADYPQALHVRIYAPLEVRAARIQQSRELSTQEMALQVVRKADEQRNDWFRHFFPGISWKDARHYHLMINTARIPEEVAVEIIVQAARSTAG